MGVHHQEPHRSAVTTSSSSTGGKGSPSVTVGPAASSAGDGRPARPDIPTLQEFNTAEPDAVAEVLRACLDIPEWVREVTGGRSYADLAELRRAGEAAGAGITWDQVAGALARHPRIGERHAAAPGTGTAAPEAAWSAAEQAGVERAQEQGLAEGNRAYEQRFGHIFLICASGLSGQQMLENLTARLGNDAQTERGIVMDELRKIAALRLAKAVTG